jgi:hypothetical protein
MDAAEEMHHAGRFNSRQALGQQAQNNKTGEILVVSESP